MRYMLIITLWGTLFLLVAALAAGCAAFEDPSVKATENAESTEIWQQVSQIETQSVTLAALQQTADAAVLLSGQLTQVSAERANLQGTLSVLQSFNGNTNSQPSSSDPFVPGAAGTPAVGIDGGPSAGPAPSPAAQDDTASGQTGTTVYTGTTISSDINSDFCASDRVNTFSTATELVYFVTTAVNLVPGVQFTLRISDVDGMVLDTHQNFWTSDGDYESTCIYYAIDDSNITFESGNYTVELLANNTSVASASFSFTE